jgi:hypothetical protein
MDKENLLYPHKEILLNQKEITLLAEEGLG